MPYINYYTQTLKIFRFGLDEMNNTWKVFAMQAAAMSAMVATCSAAGVAGSYMTLRFIDKYIFVPDRSK
jgi:hypothetical protein